jgi:serine/threonine-protein kinase
VNGAAFGRFRIERELGSSRFGRVFLAVEAATGWRVVVKLFAVDSAVTPGEREGWARRLLRDADRAAEFTHPSVVGIHEMGLTTDGSPYIVRDYVHGWSLADYAKDATHGLVAHKLAWLRELALVLGAIHDAGLLHYDVKPRGVMVRKDGALRVLEFGIGHRSVDRVAGVRRPSSELLIRAPPNSSVPPEAPAYLAPEQLGHQTLGAPADQFSWGVTAYELLAGQLPWGAPSV